MLFLVLLIVTGSFFYIVHKLTTKDEDEDEYNPVWWKILFWVTMLPSVMWIWALFSFWLGYPIHGNQTLALFRLWAMLTYPLYMIAVNMLVLYVFKRTQSKVKALSMYLVPVVVYFAGVAYLII